MLGYLYWVKYGVVGFVFGVIVCGCLVCGDVEVGVFVWCDVVVWERIVRGVYYGWYVVGVVVLVFMIVMGIMNSVFGLFVVLVF